MAPWQQSHAGGLSSYPPAVHFCVKALQVVYVHLQAQPVGLNIFLGQHGLDLFLQAGRTALSVPSYATGALSVLLRTLWRQGDLALLARAAAVLF